jgi:ectoine hydroxylase
VTEFNGPLTFIPGSQRHGLLDVEVRPETAWQDTLTSELRYRIPAAELARAIEGSSMVAPKGPRGSVLMFDSTLLHASAPNMSPFDRRMVIMTFNSIENTLRPVPEPRPEFIAARDFSPLHRIGDDALKRHAGASVTTHPITPAW